VRVYWERVGMLGPIYRLGRQGLNDRQIANRLNLTEVRVHDCISWMLQSFKFSDRTELARDAFSIQHPLKPRTVER
jgi:DNA-binding NarL/FixJ family response regulator